MFTQRQISATSAEMSDLSLFVETAKNTYDLWVSLDSTLWQSLYNVADLLWLYTEAFIDGF